MGAHVGTSLTEQKEKGNCIFCWKVEARAARGWLLFVNVPTNHQ